MRFAASLLLAFALTAYAAAPSLPGTAGETLTGKRIVPAQVEQGHDTIFIAAFSHKAGARSGQWMQAIEKDPALASTTAYQLVMLGGVPSMIRGAVKGMIRKGVPPADQPRFIVLTQDEEQWRAYFHVTADEDPYVVMLDASGKILWSGHGSASDLEPELRAALR